MTPVATMNRGSSGAESALKPVRRPLFKFTLSLGHTHVSIPLQNREVLLDGLMFERRARPIRTPHLVISI